MGNTLNKLKGENNEDTGNAGLHPLCLHYGCCNISSCGDRMGGEGETKIRNGGK